MLRIFQIKGTGGEGKEQNRQEEIKTKRCKAIVNLSLMVAGIQSARALSNVQRVKGLLPLVTAVMIVWLLEGGRLTRNNARAHPISWVQGVGHRAEDY